MDFWIMTAYVPAACSCAFNNELKFTSTLCRSVDLNSIKPNSFNHHRLAVNCTEHSGNITEGFQ